MTQAEYLSQMITKELIEKQIEEASDHLARSAASIQDDELSSSLVFLGEACARLLQIVQNQQSQIDSLIAAHPFDAELEEWRREKRLKNAYKEGEL